jgi:hypothetical protein
VILAALNSSRNSNYYEKDGLYFWGAGLSSIITYMGSPFQVAVAAAQNLVAITVDGPEGYRRYADIDITLNSNSAFVQLHEDMGFAAWVFLAFGLTVAGVLFGFFRGLGKTAFLLPCAGLLYAAAEFWRLDLFRQGIFIVWMIFGISIPAILTFKKVLFSGPRLNRIASFIQG